MNRWRWLIGFIFIGCGVAAEVDPYLWLEDTHGERAMAFVKKENVRTVTEARADEAFARMESQIRSILDASDRVPGVRQYGKWLYNFWRDGAHPRGLWRRCSLAEYRKAIPAWETVLDLDALARAEEENWVWKWSGFRAPDYARCMISLSRGGSDASVVREFDVVKKAFVADGFVLAEAKHRVGWRDADRLFVATDFGEGSLTEAGYPRIVKSWRRGTPLADAEAVFEGKVTDMSVSAYTVDTPVGQYDILYRNISFWSNEARLNWEGAWALIDKPADAEVSIFRDQFLFQLRSPWNVAGKTWPSGALVSAPIVDWMRGTRRTYPVYIPKEGGALVRFSFTKQSILLNESMHVKNRIQVARLGEAGWTLEPLPMPLEGTVSAVGANELNDDSYWLSGSGFLNPYALYRGDLVEGASEKLKSNPAYFDADGYEVQQHFAVSGDGTRIPYFQVSRKGLVLDHSHPTLMAAYGGFEIPMLPRYSASVGAAWLVQGGVYVLANLRGGGEYGPVWHRAAIKENKQKSYDDCAAIAEDLIARGVTSATRLGIRGGSNGGLLVGNMMVQHPELFGAMVCQVPLLDMQRFNKLLAGASWVGEYGDPDDPEQWKWLRRTSPYHQAKAGQPYPPVLFTTSTRDDRVHPGHARKMVARLRAQGYDQMRYYENIEGGHGGAANNEQRAFVSALSYQFLWKTLSDTDEN